MALESGPPQELEIREAHSSEYSAIVSIIRDGFSEAEARLGGKPYATVEQIEERKKKGYETYVIRDGLNIVGTFNIIPDDPDYDNGLFFGRLAVHEKLQGRGIGSTAVTWAIEHARKLGRDMVGLNFMDYEPGLEQYYERFGFKQEGQPIKWKVFTVIPMVCRLENLPEASDL